MTGIIFGFGSLINKNSILTSVLSVKPSRVAGLRREWIEPFHANKTVFRALGVVEAGPHDVVHGATVFVPKTTLESLYAREASYRRVVVDAIDQYENLDYATTFETRETAPAEAKIPLSYIATVAEGFVQQYGKRGVELFISNTHGWEAGIVNDVGNPVYPRSPQRLDEIAKEILNPLKKVAKIEAL